MRKDYLRISKLTTAVCVLGVRYQRIAMKWGIITYEDISVSVLHCDDSLLWLRVDDSS